MDGHSRSGQMRPSLPCENQAEALARAPKIKESCKASCKQWCECLRLELATKSGGGAVRQVGRGCKVDAEADNDAIIASLEQDSGKLLSRKQQVVGPFQHQCLAWNRSVQRLDEREASGKRECLSRRIIVAQVDEDTAVEIAVGRDPVPALAALACCLLERDEPVSFDGIRIGKQVGIGRAGALDDPDSAQKSDPAARSVSELNGPIKR